MDFIVKVLSVDEVTHDVRRIRVEKPEGYIFTAGHATEVAINKAGWKAEKRPFTFTSLNSDPWLEFTIKCYEDHDGVTSQVRDIEAGDQLIIGDSWGAIEYKGTGYFIAGGAGITPFMAILRQLHKDNELAGNKLFFANKTAGDIIYEQELTAMLGGDAIFILTEAGADKYPKGYMDIQFLEKNIEDISKHCYICGPDKMIACISKILTDLGAEPDAVVFEK